MDMQKIRANFPALSKNQVFFDNAGGSQVLGSVIDSYVMTLGAATGVILLIVDLSSVGYGTT